MSGLYDAAIIGGGPAGCAAAIALAERGLRAVLIEAKTYPHHKVCGEFVSPEGVALLRRLGVDEAIRALGVVEIDTLRFTGPYGALWETRLPGTAWGLTRAAFDAALAERARSLGVEVREGTTAAGVAGDLAAGFAVQTRSASGAGKVEARAVIAAHGKRAGLDRALKRRFLECPQPFVGLKAHFSGPPLPGCIELHAFPGGYCGISDVEGGLANVCFLARQDVLRAHGGERADPSVFAAWMQAQNPRLGAWLSQARQAGHWLAIGQVPFVAKTPLEGDVLMAGDAAGVIAPLAGDGISMALHGGLMAASGAADYLCGRLSAADLRRSYAAAWRRTFDARLWLGRALQPLLLRPALADPGLRLIAALPPLADFLIAHTRDLGLLKKITV